MGDEAQNVYISNRFCAREGESPDQQRSFVQYARREQLSAMSTLECVHEVDISCETQLSMCQPQGMRGPITCFLTREGGTSNK